MEPSLQPLLALAFRRSDARQANTAIAEARELAGAEEPFSYEVLVDPAKSLALLAAEILPKLVYHLESRGAHPPACEGVFLSLFVGDALHFIQVRDALPLLANSVELSIDELVARYGTGELRRAIRPGEELPIAPASRGPLLLPGKPKP